MLALLAVLAAAPVDAGAAARDAGPAAPAAADAGRADGGLADAGAWDGGLSTRAHDD